MTAKAKAHWRGQGGYSLLEILVGLAIIAMITALVGPRLIGQVDKSKRITAEAQIQMLRTSLETLRLDIGRYPSAQEGLGLLEVPMSAGPLWAGPYISGKLPGDPWGNDYKYSPPATNSQEPKIYSLGADNSIGGSGQNKDIGR